MIEKLYGNLSFIYSTVNSAKSANLLMMLKHLETQGKDILTLKAEKDSRDGEYIVSRVGIKTKVDLVVKDEDDLFKRIENTLRDVSKNYVFIFVDEAEFLTEKQIIELSKIVDKYNIGIACFGLLTDFYGNLFPASKMLIELADNKIDFGNTVCKCGRKAIMNMKIDKEGNPTREGESISPGFHFIPVCRKCYREAFDEKN